MSNIAKAFANGKAFIPFVTCGDPDLEDVYKRQILMMDGLVRILTDQHFSK